jgi:hypothetical protein
MKLNRVFLASMMALAGAAVGCGGGDTGTDAGMMTGNDTGMMTGDDAAMTSQAVVAVGSAMMNMPADFACAGMNMAPMAGAPVMANVEVEAISLMSFPVVNAPIELYPGDTVRATCDGDCVMGMTDATGVASVSLPAGGWFGYRLPAAGAGMMANVPVLGYFYTFPSMAGETETVTAIGTVAAGLVASGLNRELTVDTAAVSGSVRDCDTTEVANVHIRFFRGATEICPGGCPADDTTMPRITGLSDSTIPARSPDGLTRYAGRFAGIVPAAGGAVRIEAWGVTEEGGAEELLGCEEVLVEGNTVTVAVIPPLRSDYAAGSGCAGRM